MSIAELIRQDVLDLHPEPPRPPCPIPPRLLILACSATKATGEGLTARDRYQGPLWQTLRVADPDCQARYNLQTVFVMVQGLYGELDLV